MNTTITSSCRWGGVSDPGGGESSRPAHHPETNSTAPSWGMLSYHPYVRTTSNVDQVPRTE